MATPYLGEIRLFGFTFAPYGWSTCAGQTLSIQQNEALFSLLGTTYGGNGVSNFQLPNLQGSAPVGAGQGPGLSAYTQGDFAGQPNVTVTVMQSAVHTHSLNVQAADASTDAPGGAVLAQGVFPDGRVNKPYPTYVPATPAKALAQSLIQPAGGNQPHPNQQPYLVLNYCIALSGVFPQRP